MDVDPGPAPGGTAAQAPLGAGPLFELLSDGTRRRILALLLDHREICVCRLVGALGQPQPKVSRHLAAMREAGLLVARRKGAWILYRYDPQVPGWAMRVVAMMADGTRADPLCVADRRRLEGMRLCGEDGYP